MKKIISVFIAIAILISVSCVYALDLDKAYKEFKTKHPEFVYSLLNEGIDENTIISFIEDVHSYVLEIEKTTTITRENFEKHAMKAVMDVSSREKYYNLQDTLLILYPDAIKLAITEGKVATEFKPLVNTIKDIYFAEASQGGDNSGGSGGGGSSGGPSSDDKEEKPEAPEIIIPPISEGKFSDVNSTHWAYTPIEYLANNFILNGYLDGTFKPDNNITRAEFAKIIVSATDSFDSTASSTFTDVPSNEWYYGYVSTAYKLGYITGYPDGSFHPNDNITRADICTIVNRVLNASPQENTVRFIDDVLIPSYAKNSVYALTSKGIINGYSDGTFAPTTYATRAQTAKIIYAALFNK